MDWLHFFFGWYQGAVWSNLLASVLWVIPGYILGRAHLKKLHEKLDKIHKHLGIDSKIETPDTKDGS